MPRTSWRTYNARQKVVEQARRLARSGKYADHTAILPLLENLEGFEAAQVRFEERAMRLQLDRLCASARDPSTTRLDLAALRESRRTAKAAMAKESHRSSQWRAG